jgi:hypothetical protein
MYTKFVKANSFHGNSDTKVVNYPNQNKTLGTNTVDTPHFVVQMRELSYRFYLHQHPHVQPLTQRLLRKGTPGLQAADTEYAPGEISLPYGVDVELVGNVDKASAPSAARIGFLDKVTATTAGGASFEIAKGIELTLAAVTTVEVSAGTALTLVEYIKPTPLSAGHIKAYGRQAGSSCHRYADPAR